eukprot:COSAG02_NODE_3537_length_6594_cov_4.011239_1_plen_48_part_10
MGCCAYDTCYNTLADPVDHGGFDFVYRFFAQKTAIFGISESITTVQSH